MIEVIRSGPLTTVQDLGRPGLAHLGVGRSGAADRTSLRLANRLVGNRESRAALETTFGGRNLQQLRWPPSNIADTPAEALSRLFMLTGAHYSDPEFSWKWEVAPAGIGTCTTTPVAVSGPAFERVTAKPAV